MSTSGFPLLFGPSGPVATPPGTINASIIAAATLESPGLTANLPGILIEDISSTETAACVIQDQARVDAVNNVSPYGANQYVLAQLGQQFGIAQGLPSNGNALVTVTGTAGYVMPPGFTFGDGTNQYVAVDGAIVGTGGTVSGVYVVATNPNVFAIPANTITQVVSSVASPYSLSVTNPLAGNPAQAAETVESYRSRVMGSFQNALSGSATYTKSLLLAVPGVVARIVSIIQNGSSWEVICSGGDPYAMAYAIYTGITTPGLLIGASAGGSTQTVSIVDPPNNYTIKYVAPASQAVTCTVKWNTTLSGFTSTATVNQLIAQTSQAYINGITVGQPINLLVWTELIQQAIAAVLAPTNLTTLTFISTGTTVGVNINGTPTPPSAGTSIIPGDSESYFSAANGAIVAEQA